MSNACPINEGGSGWICFLPMSPSWIARLSPQAIEQGRRAAAPGCAPRWPFLGRPTYCIELVTVRGSNRPAPSWSRIVAKRSRVGDAALLFRLRSLPKVLVRAAAPQPTFTASTKNLGDRVEVRIRDNGTGMTPDVKERCSTRFSRLSRRERARVLGSRLVYDIIVKQHAGSLEVDTQLGEFTEIRIILPRAAVFL